ncbi:ABC transporter ATP-binding protein [Bdellovibrio bacteriovorus]|uniref:ABC transporter ATP-binding protein n=1 Tax=Bdellovibrio bacteriovorus TaxID=959 RepID=UPI0021D2D037|nr:ABC transporter ATP-binding protein [Bdellovibrio bacteriovorus]UXR63646.1 ABC transporter ATP-binding protein [Bdellovibrio bacteriovorus]
MAEGLMNTSGVSLKVTGLFKKLRQTQALQGLDMTFESGLIHGIIGPEGAGKTTLLRHLMGLLHADRGEIQYRRQDGDISFSELRQNIAYMPQTQSLYPELSIHEHLEFFRTLYQLSDQDYAERRRALLQMSRLEEFTERLASELSGGMYKKLGLICSLLASPLVLLLDEPTNGVDPLSRRDFWQLLYDLQKSEDILILVTTSYMDEALKCQKVHLLFDGKTLLEGQPDAILQQKKCKSFDEVFLQYDALEESP